MMRVHIDRAFEILDRRQRIAAIGPDAAHLKRILRPAGRRRRDTAKQFLGIVDPTCGTNRTRTAERAAHRVEACLSSQFETTGCIIMAVQRSQTLSVNEQCNAVASDTREELVGLLLTSQQVRADARTGQNAFRLFTSFDSPAKVSDELSDISQLRAAYGIFQLREIVLRQRAFGFKNVFNVEHSRWRHFVRFLSIREGSFFETEEFSV